MTYTTLISTEVLAGHLADPAVAIVDCSYLLGDEGWGGRHHEQSHIPGAVYADLLRDLSGELTGRNGRHPLPHPRTLARTFGRLGIANDLQVVAYDQDTGSWASRLWWLLRWLGHDRVAVLDGGFAKWVAEGRRTASGVEAPPQREFVGRVRPEMSVDAAQVATLAGRPEARLVDARAPERYRGENEPTDRVAGHIPGALNHFFKKNLEEDLTFRSPDELRAQFRETIGDASLEHVVCYCGSGVTACHNLLALERAGLGGAKLYAGSWSEWSSDPARPIERGAPQD
jgi:thiosulfate/3-mercaptopyruvate sulfurtransferase